MTLIALIGAELSRVARLRGRISRLAPLALIGLIELSTSACNRVPQLVPQDPPDEYVDEYSPAAAPIVIVGVLGEDVPVGRIQTVKSRFYSYVQVRLRRVRVKVENVLRGQVEEKVWVYYFEIASTYTGPPPLGYWKSTLDRHGKRKLLYLRRDGEVIRTACDLHNCCVLDVDSGSHRNYKPGAAKSFEERKADILLTEGEGAAAQTFASNLSYAIGHVRLTIALPRVEALTASNSLPIQKEACWQINQYKEKLFEFRLGPLPLCASREKAKQ